MASASFEMKGRNLSGGRMVKEIEKAMMKDLKDTIQKQLRGIRCPIHGQSPSVTFRGTNLKNLKGEISGCCEELVRIAGEKLS